MKINDELGLIALVLKTLLLAVITVNYAILVLVEHSGLLNNYLTQYSRTIALNLRVALLIPLYAVLVFTESFFINYIFAFDVIIAVIDGYCMICFIRMILLFIGNKQYIFACIQFNPRKFTLFDRWSRADPAGFFSFCHMWLVQFIIMRPIAILVQAAMHSNIFQLHNVANKSLLVASIIIQFTSTVCGMFGLVRITLSLQDSMIQCLQPLLKLTFLKTIILLLVVQDILFTALLYDTIYFFPSTTVVIYPHHHTLPLHYTT